MVREKNFYRTMFKIALPSAFQSLITFLVVVVDDMMVSSLANGVAAQAAVSQINSITAFYTATVTGLVSGSSVLISQYWGRKDMDRIKKIFSIVLAICLITALIFVGAMLIVPEAITGIVIDRDEAEVTRMAVRYLTLVCFSYIPFAVSNALVGMLRSIEVVKITLYIAILSLFSNIGLNYLLIFGKLGLPAMGVAGAGLATVLARIIELALVWVYTFRVQKQLDIAPKDLFRTEKWLVRDYMKYGLPVGVTDLQWSFIGMLKAAIIGQMGAAFMAANSITNSMMNLGTMFTFALAGGACVVVGKAVGAKDYEKAKEYSKTIQIMFFGIGLVMALVVFLLRAPFISLYGSASDPAVHKLCMTMIALGAVTLIGTSYHASCFVGINRGAGDSRFVAMVDMICGWLVVLPATFLAAFTFHAPLPIVFLCTRIDQCFKWLIAFIRLRGDKWIKNVTRDKEAA